MMPKYAVIELVGGIGMHKWIWNNLGELVSFQFCRALDLWDARCDASHLNVRKLLDHV